MIKEYTDKKVVVTGAQTVSVGSLHWAVPKEALMC